MSKWSKLYEEQASKAGSLSAFIEQKILSKKKLIDIVMKYCPRNGRILEAGSGSGITTIYLAQAGYRARGVDADVDMVKFARSLAAAQSSAALFEVGDIRTLDGIGRFDVIFSNGVMEHFSDSDIITIVDRHLSLSDHVVISIPSDFFSDDQRMYGDERFMSVNRWRQIFSATRGTCIEEFSFNPEKGAGEKSQFIGFVMRPR
jgi:2-polyprenyl-3-methyl-5-hydroxy-6-metoxy-1,4-benzoquinol methylase